MTRTQPTLTLFVLLSLLLGCTSSQQSPQVPEGALIWSSQRRITWDDFLGTAIKTTSQTASQIVVNNPAVLSKTGLFSNAVVVGTCFMDRQHSWADKTKVTAQLLSYNQSIFDIYELYTRKLRKRFESVNFGFGGDPSSTFNEIYQENEKHLLDTLSEFQTDTKLGADTTGIRTWQSKLNVWLSELEKYETK